MTRLVLTVIAVAALASSCTLLLPTEQLITPCVVNDDCGDGFECLENACLPIDEDLEQQS